MMNHEDALQAGRRRLCKGKVSVVSGTLREMSRGAKLSSTGPVITRGRQRLRVRVS